MSVCGFAWSGLYTCWRIYFWLVSPPAMSKLSCLKHWTRSSFGSLSKASVHFGRTASPSGMKASTKQAVHGAIRSYKHIEFGRYHICRIAQKKLTSRKPQNVRRSGGQIQDHLVNLAVSLWTSFALTDSSKANLFLHISSCRSTSLYEHLWLSDTVWHSTGNFAPENRIRIIFSWPGKPKMLSYALHQLTPWRCHRVTSELQGWIAAWKMDCCLKVWGKPLPSPWENFHAKLPLAFLKWWRNYANPTPVLGKNTVQAPFSTSLAGFATLWLENAHGHFERICVAWLWLADLSIQAGFSDSQTCVHQ